MLVGIKLLHTLIWAVLAGFILALPILAIRRRFQWASILTLAILIECTVLGVNGGRCPLTDWAAQYTNDRAANFDIYLPQWLAQYNKQIFGTLFLVGVITLLCTWFRTRRNIESPKG